MTKRERLEAAGIIEKNLALDPVQERAIEKLTDKELNFLISTRNTIKEKFNLEMIISPPTHHH